MSGPFWGCRLAVHLLVVAVVGFAFLHRPWRGDPSFGQLNRYIEVAPDRGFLFDIDSSLFLRLARRPGDLLKPKSRRQSRPMYVLLGAGLGRALEPLFRPPQLKRGILGSPHYFAYLAINVITLLVALELFARAQRRRRGRLDPKNGLRSRLRGGGYRSTWAIGRSWPLPSVSSSGRIRVESNAWGALWL